MTTEVVQTTLTELPLSQILADYLDGDELGWPEQFAWLDKHVGASLTWRPSFTVRRRPVPKAVPTMGDGNGTEPNLQFRPAEWIGRFVRITDSSWIPADQIFQVTNVRFQRETDRPVADYKRPIECEIRLADGSRIRVDCSAEWLLTQIAEHTQGGADNG